MQETTKTSSRQILEELSRHVENGNFSEESMYQMEQEIEKEMEEFDLEKKKKSAKAAEDLGKLIITT